MKRLHQIVLIISTLLGSWLEMQAVHESGHVLGAWLTGGRVARVVLDPLTISRTDLGPAKGAVNLSTAYGSLATCVTLLVLGFIVEGE